MPFERGQHIKATLHFEKAGNVVVDFPVEEIGAQTGGSTMPGGASKHQGH
jgi:copper(I)-binding protein